MRNTTAVTLRAMVMLTCLVLIPAIAIFGKSLPDLAMQLLQDGWDRLAGESDLGSVRECSPVVVDDDRGSTPVACDGLAAPPFVRSDDSDQAVRGASVRDLGSHRGSAGPPRAEMPVGYHAAIDPNMGATRLPATFPSPGSEGNVSNGFSRDEVSGVPVQAMNPWEAAPDNRSPSASSQGRVRGAIPSESGSASSLDGGAFVMIQERLRDMGAVSYRLETWGDRHQLYRFQCEITVRGDPSLTRHFEATDGHALLAMHKVLVEAEAWQATR